MANGKTAGYTLKDNSKEVLKQFEHNIPRALTAIGEAAVEVTTDYMKKRYYRPIYLTGDLIRDVNYKVHERSVDIGNSLNYANWVHNGTMKMAARPYLKDAILENRKIWEEVSSENLSKGFK